MLKEERKQRILAALARDGTVQAAVLSEALAVSEDTIRRDLRELDDAGLLRRVHGGALPRSPAAADYAEPRRQAPEAKVAIARAAAALIRPGQVVILDGGTTTLQVAQHLPHDLRATIVTNSAPIALALAAHPRVEIVLAGGRLFRDSLVTVGAVTIETFAQIRADLCLLGVCSLHPRAGITVLDLEEAYVKRAMIASAAEVAALAAADKLGTASPYVVGPLRHLTHLVTEASVDDATLHPYREAGLNIVRP